MNRQQEHPPPTVPDTATQGGSVRLRWSWVEPAAWTERMLTALEAGVKGNVWFSLIDKVCQAGVFSLNPGPCRSTSILSEVGPSTGEPDAGKPPVRFGGRGDRNQS